MTKKRKEKLNIVITEAEIKDFKSKEASGSYLKEYSFRYDKKIREDFRAKHIKEVEAMRKSILEKYPHLKYNKKYLEYRIDQEIFPSLFIRSNVEVSLDTTLSTDMDGLALPPPLRKKSRSKNPRPKSYGAYQEGMYPDMLHDLISEVLDCLTDDEKTLISKIYGIGEFIDNPIPQSDIAKSMKISQAAISVMKKRILNKLKIALIKDRVEIEEDSTSYE